MLDVLLFRSRLNMRTTITVYRTLLKFVNAMDAESLANGGPPEDPSIDAHFRSGVYLGAGMATLILSLLPQKLLTIVELFGYKGDRKEALELLCRAGGWSADSSEPAVSTGKSGVFVRFPSNRFQLRKVSAVPYAIWHL